MLRRLLRSSHAYFQYARLRSSAPPCLRRSGRRIPRPGSPTPCSEADRPHPPLPGRGRHGGDRRVLPAAVEGAAGTGDGVHPRRQRRADDLGGHDPRRPGGEPQRVAAPRAGMVVPGRWGQGGRSSLFSGACPSLRGDRRRGFGPPPEPEAGVFSPSAQSTPSPERLGSRRSPGSAGGTNILSGLLARTPRLRWIAHAGLAASEPGGAPTRETLAEAVRIHVDWIELDVRVSRDGRLVVRHGPRLPSGHRVEELTAAEVRARGGAVLSLDEAVEVVGGRVPVVLDLKGPSVAR